MTKSSREQAYEVAKWIQKASLDNDTIDSESIIPVTVQLSHGDISFQLYGCAYKQWESERFYLVGGTPYEQLVSMTGVSGPSGMCIDFGSPYFIAGYMPLENYHALSLEDMKRFHAFGPNIILCQAFDDWLCEGRIVVDLNVSYYSVIQ